MSALSSRHGTAFRLLRVGALLVACLVFLWGCEVSRSSTLGDVPEYLVLAGLAAVGALVAGWFEIRAVRAARRTVTMDDGRWRVVARVGGAGELVFVGHDEEPADSDDPEDAPSGWIWTFPAESVDAVRAVLDSCFPEDDPEELAELELLDLLGEVAGVLDPVARADPGAWLHGHGVAGERHEWGVDPTQTTRTLPVVGSPLGGAPARRGVSPAARKKGGAVRASGARAQDGPSGAQAEPAVSRPRSERGAASARAERGASTARAERGASTARAERGASTARAERARAERATSGARAEERTSIARAQENASSTEAERGMSSARAERGVGGAGRGADPLSRGRGSVPGVAAGNRGGGAADPDRRRGVAGGRPGRRARAAGDDAPEERNRRGAEAAAERRGGRRGGEPDGRAGRGGAGARSEAPAEYPDSNRGHGAERRGRAAADPGQDQRYSGPIRRRGVGRQQSRPDPEHWWETADGPTDRTYREPPPPRLSNPRRRPD